MPDTPRIAVLRDIESPPGGWRMTVPETGLTTTGPYAKSVLPKVLSHMMANGVPIPPDFEEWAQDVMCRESGHGRPWCGAPPPAPVKGRAKILSLGVAKRFLRTVLHAIRSHQFVDTDEALRRAAICLECPLAMEIGGCRGCGSIFGAVKRAMPVNPVQMPREQEFCGACACWIQAKVWLPNDVLNKAEELDRPEYAEGCWRND